MDDFINFGQIEEQNLWDYSSCMTPEDECETFHIKQDFNKCTQIIKKGEAIR